ncbi:LysR family transcriptional regulator [Aliiroseovarius subalbicans]|uniref:LysR family transcriptional regulator n=1 Tax=Aliiroseovarius subalbicans TaxID=2925840 RepID=UPI001F561DDB|nr:LysR family transcriptional regulator [Aliiroseovarius subalbicans]MCI2400952.1 LysR family transcriptional regulator [Aliiroseovarius subalbicans]
MNLTLRQIRYFIAAAEAGQVSKAAVEVNVSQSAITTAIKSLEDLIGTSLFDRHSGGVSLTYEGSLFLNHAKGIVDSVEEAVRIPRRVQQDVRGSFCLAVTYTVAGYFLPPLLSRFMHAFPNVTVNLVEADREAIEEGLISGAFDLAVMLTSNISNHDELAHSVLLRSRRRLWLNNGHRFLGNQSATLEEIAQEPYIMLTVDEASDTALRYWNQTPFQPRTLIKTSSVEAIRSMVAGGMGVSVLSDMVYRPWSLEGKRVDVMEVNDIIPTMDVGLAWSKHAVLNRPAKAFFELMELAVLS